MGVCASKPASEAEVVVVPIPEPALTVAIVGVRGLRAVEWFPGTERFFFCTLRIAGQEGELHKTKLVKDTVAPVWKEEAAVSAYSLGDALEFAVWVADADGQGDMLGQAVLEPERFAQQGFHGEVQLTVGGKPKPSFLTIKVKLEGKGYPEGPLKEFSVPIENPKKKSIGLDLDGQDVTTLYVLAVKAGLIQVYNKETEPLRPVLMKATRFHMTVAWPAPPESETASGKADEAGKDGEAQQEEGQEARKADGNGEEWGASRSRRPWAAGTAPL